MRAAFAATVALLLIAGPLPAQEMSLNDFLEVAGHVRAAAASPVEGALVIAFSLSDELNLRTNSGRQGQFALPPLPVGVYRVVAVKRGFLPAFVTVTPTKKDHDVVLELENQAEASEARKADAWSIRRTLPKDVLRQIDQVLGVPTDSGHGDQLARFAGSMESLAGYSGATAERELEKTSVAFRSDVGNWGVEFQGSRQQVGQTVAADGSEIPAEAADVALEVRSSASNAYRVASTRASWRHWPSDRSETGMETHSFAWHGKSSSVQLRYLSHENLFVTPGLESENTVEVAGNALVYRGERSNVGVSLRLKQDSLSGEDEIDAVRDRYADLATTGRWVVADGLGLEYGVVTRIGSDTLQVMPQTAAEIRFGDAATVLLAGAYKIDTTPEVDHASPGIAHLGQMTAIDTRYKYSVTVSSGMGENARISASARRAAADALTFLLFDDRFDEFWDGLYLLKGDVLTDGVLSIRTGVGPSLEIAMVTSAGRVDSRDAGYENKRYYSGEIQTHYEPTGTSLDVSYRMLEQPDLVDEHLLREIERLSVVIGQSLHLPVDLRLLLGFSVASEGETVAEVGDSYRSQKRLMGGLSFSF